MARIGITYEEVELQAETLVARGENPTLEKVRRALGDRGSNSTLSKYINEWRGRRASFTTPPAVQPTMSDPVNQAVHRVWHQLQEETQSEISKVRKETEEAILNVNMKRELLEIERNNAF
jgi:hypothetical protein